MLSNFFHTIRYLKIKQIYHRIIFSFIRTKIDENSNLNLRPIIKDINLPIQKKKSLINSNTYCFLNETKSLSEIGWDGCEKSVSKLWRYNQHYFDDLNAINSKNRKTWHNQLLTQWVLENKVGKSIGWDSYPTSIRIVNWIKWHLSGNNLSNKCIDSLVLQSRWLSKRIEWHILGNHLFSNAKALIFAGLFFSSEESEEWLKIGLEILENEVVEQILDDGGNFELSPMYHSIFLEDILDIINISRTYPGIIKEKQINKLIKISFKMMDWLETMIHPDGKISFFNDSAFEIAPSFNELKNYFIKLGLSYESKELKKTKHLSDSGYLRVSSENMVSLLDVAKVGPDYIPSHAHADTLSFELSLFGKRLIINGGTSTYEAGHIREYERSTKAHNTVLINSQNSSEVWSKFRVARRAYPYDLEIEELDDVTRISCKHDGYKRLRGKPVHSREWSFLNSSLIIKDKIGGSFDNAFAYFHFHPSVNVIKKKDNIWYLNLINHQNILFNIKSGKAILEKSYYSTEFGKRIATQTLKVKLDKEEGSHIQIMW